MYLIKKNTLLILSIILTIIIHFIMYDEFGYYVDEIGSMYDAYCISNYGVDRWLQSYPIHFMNYGDGQSAIFVYILAILFKLFGYSKLIIRIVPLFFNILTMVCISKIAGLLDVKYKEVTAVLYMALPVTTLLFQFGLESHFMLSLSSLFIYLYLKSINTNKSIYFILAGTIGGLIFYTYAISYIVIPIFVLLTSSYLIVLKRTEIKRLMFMIIPIILLGLPLLYVQLINILDLEQTVILGITFPKFIKFRIGDLSLSNIFRNIYYTFLNTNFYDGCEHTSIKLFGNIYYVLIPFNIIGFIYNIKRFKKSNVSAFLVLWHFVMYLLGSLLKDETLITNTRFNGIYLSKIIFRVCGLHCTILYFNKNVKVIKGVIISTLFILTIMFYSYYLTSYNLEEKSRLFREEYSDIPDMNKVIVVPDNYVYLLWSEKINPYDFDINKNGYRQYKNFIIGYNPNGVNPNYAYLVYKTDYVSQNNLENLSFKYLQFEDYRIYYR